MTRYQCGEKAHELTVSSDADITTVSYIDAEVILSVTRGVNPGGWGVATPKVLGRGRSWGRRGL